VYVCVCVCVCVGGGVALRGQKKIGFMDDAADWTQTSCWSFEVPIEFNIQWPAGASRAST